MARDKVSIGVDEVVCAAPVCMKAVRRYVAELRKHAPLLATCKARRSAVVFEGGGAERTLAIEWFKEVDADAEPMADWERGEPEDRPDADSDSEQSTARAVYARTIAALSRDPAAAEALLERV